MKWASGPDQSQGQSPWAPQLPRYRSTLDDSRHLFAKLAVDHRPPWDQRELVALLDNSELAAGELDGPCEGAADRLTVPCRSERHRLVGR